MKRVPAAWRMTWKDKARMMITVGGVGFTVMLMLFLLGVYGGVKAGSTNYVLRSPARIWICEKNSTNLLRSSSFLQASFGEEIHKVRGVAEVTGILRVLASTQVRGKPVTLFVFGFDPDSRLSVPSVLSGGTSRIASRGIIIDKAFAAKRGLTLGDSLQVKDKEFRVSGICEGTNAIVAQFVFTRLEDAQSLLGFPGVVSFFLVSLEKGQKDADVIGDLRRRFPSLSVFTKEEFVENNLEEMKTGVLPVIWTIAFFGVLIGVTVITLMLFGGVLEKREDFALLKALGAGGRYLVSLVVKQALLYVLFGYLFGVALYFLITPALLRLVPEITLGLGPGSAVLVLVVSLTMGILGSWTPVRKLSRIFPMEVFRP